MTILALATLAVATLYESIGKMVFRRLPVLRFIGYWPDDQDVAKNPLWRMHDVFAFNDEQKQYPRKEIDMQYDCFTPPSHSQWRKVARVLVRKILRLRTVRIVWWHESKGQCPIYTRKMSRVYGYGELCCPYLFVAWREGNETVLGYGMTEQGAIDHLKYATQPDWTGEMDGEGTPQGTMVFGNWFSGDDIVEFNRAAFA